MKNPIRVALAGFGRMGAIHALHVHELAAEGRCRITALVDHDTGRARAFASEYGHSDAPVFASIAELAASGAADATVVVTPTHFHREHAATLIRAGHRVFLEKPLTGTLDGDREFAAELDRDYPHALMLAFQRRFDPPLRYAKELVDKGVIGRVFKVFSALEDSSPAPDGYTSGGILPDMAVHNVDEVLWFAGRMPTAAAVIGSRIHGSKLTTAVEDFDDAFLYLWFGEDMAAQVQVSRNHVSGYRVESILFGEEGQIHIGHFDQRFFDIKLEVYGKRGRREPIEIRNFQMRDYGKPLAEFIDRFGPAYKAEVAAFLECCATGAPFPITHRDGLQAQQAISMGMANIIRPAASGASL